VLWKEHVNVYRPVTAGIDRSNVESPSKLALRHKFWFVSGIRQSAREDSPSSRFHRQAALAESPGRKRVLRRLT